MLNTENKITLADEVVMNKIYVIREKKVMLDKDLAELYGVETKRLNEQVKRNIDRFPDDFMFQLTQEELENWKSQIATSNSIKMGLRKLPMVFTEHGVLMLSSVINSKQAIEINIQIMRIYTKLRELLLTNKDILLKLEKMEKLIGKTDKNIKLVFEYLNQFLQDQEKPRKTIGFKNND
jgi:hypothetical protein